MLRAPTPLMTSTDPTGPCIPPGFTTGTPNSQAPETHAAGDGETLWAWDISPGTTAGITVGAMAGAIIIAPAAWLLYRKRRRQREVQQHDPQHYPPPTYNPYQYNAQPHYPQRKAELAAGGGTHMPAELQ
ncbi:uncharacterized protein PG998_004347 [Apiospora kogelbergensis]|uniref:uncharacterized protein n=1 Tax=Apiospora kogelbergensis TaxID=1337665 RepID=UPI003130632A